MTPTAVFKTCTRTWYGASMLRTVDTQTDGGEGYHAITGKRFGVCLASALSPTHCIVNPPQSP